jgi:hypothetical protein
MSASICSPRARSRRSTSTGSVDAAARKADGIARWSPRPDPARSVRPPLPRRWPGATGSPGRGSARSGCPAAGRRRPATRTGAGGPGGPTSTVGRRRRPGLPWRPPRYPYRQCFSIASSPRQATCLRSQAVARGRLDLRVQIRDQQRHHIRLTALGQQGQPHPGVGVLGPARGRIPGSARLPDDGAAGPRSECPCAWAAIRAGLRADARSARSPNRPAASAASTAGSRADSSRAVARLRPAQNS